MARKKLKVVEVIYPPKQDVIEREESWEAIRDRTLKEQISVKARTPNQQKLITSILTNVITFIIGSSGSGKTFVSCGVLANLFLEGKISKIILTRPPVEVGGNKVPFYPGSHTDKAFPYMTPMIEGLSHFLGKKYVDKLIKSEIIEIVPIGLLRGRSFKHAGILADEMQNATYAEIKALLTRLDLGSRVILSGDVSQTDLANNHRDLSMIMDKLWDLRDEIGFVEFQISDVQRAGIVKKLLERI